MPLLLGAGSPETWVSEEDLGLLGWEEEEIRGAGFGDVPASRGRRGIIAIRWVEDQKRHARGESKGKPDKSAYWGGLDRPAAAPVPPPPPSFP